MLLLYMDEVEAFICFANLLNSTLMMTFFKMDADGVRCIYSLSTGLLWIG
jgi:hypothetical protein